MKTIWVKHIRRDKISFELGLALEEWCLPLGINWWAGNTVVITVLCFYVGIEWDRHPDLATRMIETLEKDSV